MPDNIIPIRPLSAPDPADIAADRLIALRQRLGLTQLAASIECPALGSIRTLQRIESADVAMTQLVYLAWLEARVAELEAREAGVAA